MERGAFHLVTDFDGVWTEPEREARLVYAALVRELAQLCGAEEPAVREFVERHARRVRAEPERHGWPMDGVFTSYVDEDFFAFPAAVGRAIEEAALRGAAADPEAERAHAAVLRAHPSMGAFLDHCYHTTCDRFRAEVEHDLTAGADEVLRWLLAAGVRVTFVTNAPVEKVIGWFGCHGFQVADAREDGGSRSPAPLRAYGRAGKQWLGDVARVLDCGGRRVHYDRPRYRAILEQERPDLVLGDVLSLDLSQPLGLRAERHPAAPRHVALLARPHTPRWVLGSVGLAPHQLDFAIRHVTELPRVLPPLLAASRAFSPARPG